MTGKCLAPAVLLSFIAAVAAGPAAAGDGWNGSTRGFGHHRSYGTAPSIGYSSPVMRVPRVGTFSRSVWVINRKRPKAEAPVLAPRATIIHVGDGLRSDGFIDPCSYEAGVCVIRADN